MARGFHAFRLRRKANRSPPAKGGRAFGGEWPEANTLFAAGEKQIGAQVTKYRMAKGQHSGAYR